ncbi:rRNA methyltransferase [Actinocorallia sp. A-T 12471]|uniref:rRNA methyltransferase n=1 Tax=Actinocorallia sp. A-T 12471 TaxID=3089813 RepID=UPI0029CB8741|nr:rRNA methyltransferase [Actinocorallia sp. A-T 12471]MDX6738316.1 rRNA methyltransferase [Actinocorallia sp. A-T 12471]
MAYKYATTRRDYAYLAGGSVFHSAPGFPVRLASETFQRALALRGAGEPVVLWDPCCGSGYLLSVLGVLHRTDLAALVASDFDPEAVRIASRNLALLGQEPLKARAAEQLERAERFGKTSYAEAAEAAERIARELKARGGDLPHSVSRADVFDPDRLAAVVAERTPDIVITDVPYGEQTDWSGPHAGEGVEGMARSLASVLPDEAVLAVAVRGRAVPQGGVRPSSSFRIGSRAVALLRAGEVLRPGRTGPRRV